MPVVLGLVLTAASQLVPPDFRQRDLFGVSIASAGDLDGDRVDDLWVGDPNLEGDPSPSRVWAVSGRTGTALRCIRAPDRAIGFGWTLARIDDVDGDGVGEVAVGALSTVVDGVHVPGSADAGRSLVSLHAGATGELLCAWHGPADRVKVWAMAGAGPALASVGDWDRDGAGDLAIGWCFDGEEHSRRGRVDVVSGASGAILRSWTGAERLDRLGFEIVLIGDVDSDGRRDLAASAVSPSGSAYVRVLRSSGDGRVDDRVHVNVEGVRHDAYPIAWIDAPDSEHGLLVVAPAFAPAGPSTESAANAIRLIDVGSLEVRSIERPDIASWHGSRVPESSVAIDGSCGARIVPLRDFDGDGSRDLLVTMPQAFTSTPAVVQSSATGKVLARVRFRDVELEFSNLGIAACTTGDLDGDGLNDFAISGASLRCGPECRGAVLHCSGRTAEPFRVVTLRDADPRQH